MLHDFVELVVAPLVVAVLTNVVDASWTIGMTNSNTGLPS